jgi:hypothetical protein
VLTLTGSGNIIGGTIADAGSGLVFEGGTLNGTTSAITYESTMNLTTGSASAVNVSGKTSGNGSQIYLNVTGAAGTGNGTINIGAGSAFDFFNSQTFNNATINLEGNGATLADNISSGAPSNETLTFGPGVTIDQIGGTTGIISNASNDLGTSGIVLQGVLNASVSGAKLSIESPTTVFQENLDFTNDGTVTVSNSDTIDVNAIAAGTGSYSIGAGSTLEFDNSVAAGATITFAASTGTLLLTDPSAFSTGTAIAGLTGTGSISTSGVLDLRGFASGGDTVTATTGVGSFNGTDTTLTVQDTTTGHTATFLLTLVGNYSWATWTVTTDHSGGFDIVDPPTAAIATIASGASLDIGTSSNETVTFTGGTGSLVLDQPQNFTGHIEGFIGTAPDAAHSDTIDLAGIDYNSVHFAESHDSSTGLLSVTDGSHTASFTFDNFDATLDFASDGNGGTLITDPPASGASGQRLCRRRFTAAMTVSSFMRCCLRKTKLPWIGMPRSSVRTCTSMRHLSLFMTAATCKMT